MADYIGQDRLICHGSMVEGTQVPLRTGGSTLQFQSKNQGYYVLKCVNEKVYVLIRYKNFNKFQKGKDPVSTITFYSNMKVHRIIMGQGVGQFFDTIIIVIHEGNPFYFKPVRQKVRRWYDAFKFVAGSLSPPNRDGKPRKSRSRSEPSNIQEATSASDQTSQQESSSHSNERRRQHSEHDYRRQSVFIGEQDEQPDEPAPEHLLPDVIDVGEESDLAKTGSPEEAYESPYSNRKILKSRQSIYKRESGGNYGVVMDINIDDEPQQDQPDTPVGVHSHPQFSRQKSRSHDNLTQLDVQEFEQLRVSGMSQSTLHAHTVGRGHRQPPAVRSKLNRTQTAAGDFHSWSAVPQATTPPSASSPHHTRAPPRHIYARIEDEYDEDNLSDCKRHVQILNREKERDQVVVELRKDHIVDGLVFVEMNSSIYIATWKKSVSLQGRFQELIHVGDQLLQVNEQQATDMKVLHSAIQSSSVAMVKLWIKRLPKAKVIHLTKKISQPWGFDVSKNEITNVYEESQISPHIDTTSKTKWIITEMNHQPVSIHSCGKDEVKHIMSSANTELALVLQPKDFIEKLVKKINKSSVKKKHLTEYIV